MLCSKFEYDRDVIKNQCFGLNDWKEQEKIDIAQLTLV